MSPASTCYLKRKFLAETSHPRTAIILANDFDYTISAL